MKACRTLTQFAYLPSTQCCIVDRPLTLQGIGVFCSIDFFFKVYLYLTSFFENLLKRSRPKSCQIVDPAEVLELVQLVPWKSLYFVSFPSGAFSSLDAKTVEFPVLIIDLPLKVGSFHCLLVQAVWLTQFCPIQFQHRGSTCLPIYLRSSLLTLAGAGCGPLLLSGCGLFLSSQHGKALALHVVDEFGYMTLAGYWGVASHSGN